MLFDWAKSLFTKKPLQRFIIVGIEYINFQLGEWLQENLLGNIVAFIDDEPWNHKTNMLNAPIKYPSELVALCEKHVVTFVISFNHQKITLSAEQCKKLNELGVKLLQLDSSCSLETSQKKLLDYLN